MPASSRKWTIYTAWMEMQRLCSTKTPTRQARAARRRLAGRRRRQAGSSAPACAPSLRGTISCVTEAWRAPGHALGSPRAVAPRDMMRCLCCPLLSTRIAGTCERNRSRAALLFPSPANFDAAQHGQRGAAWSSGRAVRGQSMCLITCATLDASSVEAAQPRQVFLPAAAAARHHCRPPSLACECPPEPQLGQLSSLQADALTTR